jgi:anti-anti-sigma regulatory factor
MAISTEHKDGSLCIILSAGVDIAQAAELKQTLTESIGSVPRVAIQVSAATAIDVTTAQLLWAAVSCSPLADTEVVVEGPWSTQVRESFLLSGLTPLLQAIVHCSNAEGANVLASRF